MRYDLRIMATVLILVPLFTYVLGNPSRGTTHALEWLDGHHWAWLLIVEGLVSWVLSFSVPHQGLEIIAWSAAVWVVFIALGCVFVGPSWSAGGSMIVWAFVGERALRALRE